MNIVLLSGGSGKRLWPLSNEVRSKQFIRLFKNNDIYESMLQRVYRQIKAVDSSVTITIAASYSQVPAIRNQLGQNVDISIEPCRRDTFPALALAASYLHDIRGVPENEAVVVCPVDPYVDEKYFHCIMDMYNAAIAGEDKLVLMGIEPTYPSEKYGYIRPTYKENGTVGYSFTEKPTEERAKKYIAQGALWNGGVFAFRISYILDKSAELLGSSEYQTLFDNYANFERISFDYAVVEQESSIKVLRHDGAWKDIGTWNALAEVIEEQIIGKGTLGAECNNVQIINELDVPILAMGLKDIVVAASSEGILVSSEAAADKIKPYVDGIKQQLMFAEKSWGYYQVIDKDAESVTVKVTLNPGHKTDYHSHEHRTEICTVISGTGKAVIDGEEYNIGPGDVLSMHVGQKHMVAACEESLQLIEVQLGENMMENDQCQLV